MQVVSLNGFRKQNERSNAVSQANLMVDFLKHNTDINEKGALRLRTTFLDLVLNKKEISNEKNLSNENMGHSPMA